MDLFDFEFDEGPPATPAKRKRPADGDTPMKAAKVTLRGSSVTTGPPTSVSTPSISPIGKSTSPGSTSPGSTSTASPATAPSGSNLARIGVAFTHDENCQSPGCFQCHISKMLNRREAGAAIKVPPSASAACGASWLRSRESAAGRGVGCKVCLAFKQHMRKSGKSLIGGKLMRTFADCTLQSPAAVQTSHLKRHGNSAWHRSAIAWAAKGDRGAIAEIAKFAPSRSIFASLWRHVKAGNTRMVIDKIGKRLKVKKVAWCLAEAIRNRNRQLLSKCETAAIYQDKKDSEMSMRFACSDANLQTAFGYVGGKICHGGHIEIVNCTKQIIDDFCTVGLGRPGGNRNLQPDKDLVDKITSRIEFNASDAEGAMVLAGRKMQEVLPKMRCGSWDLAHGFRRIASRPWSKDPVIKDIVETVVTGRQSIIRLVQNSPEFSAWYKDFKAAESNRIGDRVQNFSFAKHRFDSTAKPLGRAVLGIRALVKTASRIASLRRGRAEADHANRFLSFINTERFLLMAMCADASDEVNLLVRFVDKEEGFAVEEVPFQIESFQKKIEYLFEGGRCVESGYTRWALEAMENPILFFVAGECRAIGKRGGIPPHIVNRCAGRLAAWVAVARDVAAAEYPDFLVLHAMRIFRLEDHSRPIENTEEHNRCISRIANFFDVDEDKFRQQFQHTFGIALAIKSTQSSKLHAAEIWRLAIEKVLAHRSYRDSHPIDALAPALSRFVSWLPSSCGLERNFATMSKVIGKSSMNMGSHMKHDLFTIATSGANLQEQESIHREAALVWASNFGRHRTADRKPRIDIGTKRGPRKRTETAFLQERRPHVLAAAKSWTSSKPIEVGEEWAEKEKQFQGDKKQRRKIIAGTEGQLLPGEKKAIEKELADFEKRDGNDDRRRLREHQQRLRELQIAKPQVSFEGQTVFASVPASEIDAKVFESLGMKLTKKRSDAQVFVMPDISKIGQRDNWCLAIGGGRAVTIEYLKSRGASGSMLSFKPAISQKVLKVWASVDFVEKFRELFELLTEIVGRPGSKWSWHGGTMEDFVASSKTKALGIATIEQTKTALKDKPGVFTAASFVKHIRKIDVGASSA